MTALLDTGFLLAVLDADDELHPSCVQALQTEREVLLPESVLPELAYMVLRELGYSVLINFLQAILRGEVKLERVTETDLQRTTEIFCGLYDCRNGGTLGYPAHFDR